jgi:AmiR/NasT family two-component response regulator
VRATCDKVRRCRSQREVARASAPVRQQAGRGCIPIVEQAKGIIMAQQGCRPEEAFDLLRRASERAGVKVPVLAVQIIDHLASARDGNNVTPISLGAIRCLR